MTIDRGGRNIGEVVAAAMHAVLRKEAEDVIFHTVFACSVKRPLKIVTAKTQP